MTLALIVCLQILALFRDYDMRWPHTTLKFLSWSEVFNIGFTVTAPEVRAVP